MTDSHHSDSLKQQLLGAWVIDPADRAAREMYGDLKLDITDDGRLIYSFFERGKLQIKYLNYRLEGDVLVTGRPEQPRQERSRVSFTEAGKLVLHHSDGRSTYIRPPESEA